MFLDNQPHQIIIFCAGHIQILRFQQVEDSFPRSVLVKIFSVMDKCNVNVFRRQTTDFSDQNAFHTIDFGGRRFCQIAKVFL